MFELDFQNNLHRLSDDTTRGFGGRMGLAADAIVTRGRSSVYGARAL